MIASQWCISCGNIGKEALEGDEDMDGMERWALDHCREAIVEDLQPKYFLQCLLSKGVLSDEQCKAILAEVQEEVQAGLLLDFVECSGPKTYQIFKKCLAVEGMYDWLAVALQKSEDEWELQAAKSQSLMSMLIRGGVPHPPTNFIARPALERSVREKLEDLFRGGPGWVVLHGMAGIGKTLMAASVVRNECLFRSCCPHGVFWLKIGKDVFEDTLLTKIHTLCEKLDASYRNCVPRDIEQATDRLRQIFSSDEYSKSLLVLDDVWHDSVIRHFDFGCRILVTTQDKGIAEVAALKVAYVEMADGFTWEEVQQFFAKSLGVHVRELPSYVWDIWTCSTGSPVVANTVSEMVKMHPKDMSKAFEKSLSKLQDSSLVNVKKKSNYKHSCIAQAIELSVENLEDMKDQYYDLVIFPQNRYISEQVLAVLWNMDDWEVEETMNFFINKSMATKVPNGRRTNYYYIHDLYQQYIRSAVVNTLPNRHRRLLHEYLSRCENKFENLPSDNYILHYLGYHLQEAQMFDKFPLVFLDLKFVMMKLKATGPADVLGDYVRYKKHIEQDNKFSKEASDFKNFVRSNAYYWGMVGFDMLQVALFESCSSDVYRQAKSLCSDKPDSLYFEWCNRRNLSVPSSLTTYHICNVSCATFTADGRHVISVSDDAFVRISDSVAGKERLRLVGHEGKITCCANGFDHNGHREIILTCSADRTAIIWTVSSDDLKNCEHVRYIRDGHLIFRKHSCQIQTCSLSKRLDKAATLDEVGCLKVWSPRSGVQYASLDAHESSVSFCSCDFSPDGTRLVSAAGSFICMWNVEKKLPEWEFEDRDRAFVCCRFFPDGTRVVAALGNRLAVFSALHGSVVFYLYEPTHLMIMSCAVSPDGHLVAASTISQSVIVWNVAEHKIVDIFRGQRGWVKSVCFSAVGCVANNGSAQEPQMTYHLVSVHNMNVIVTWKVTNTFENTEAILREVLSVRFNSDGSPFTAVVDINSKIQVRSGLRQKIVAAENGSARSSYMVKCCCLSHRCDRVMYGDSLGNLKVFDIETCTTTTTLSNKHAQRCEVICCVFSRDDRVAAVGYKGGAIDIITSNQEVTCTSGHTHDVTQLRFFAEDSRILSCSFDNTLQVFDVHTGDQLVCCVGHRDSVVACDISSDESCLLSASTDKTLMLWNSTTGSKLSVLEAHQCCVRTCAFSSKYGLIASGDDSGMVAIWRFESPNIDDGGGGDKLPAVAVKLLCMLSASKSSIWVYDLAFSSDATQLVTSSDCVQWWDVSAMNENALQSVPIYGSRAVRVFSSPDFRSFVTVDDAGILYHFKKVVLTKSADLI